MKGIIGRFFFQFGLTVSFAVLVSMLVSFTLTPMMAVAHPAPGPRPPAPNMFVRFSERLLGGIDDGYRRVLGDGPAPPGASPSAWRWPRWSGRWW